MFKRLLILFILAIGLGVNISAQKIEKLKEANSSKKLSNEVSIIYGSFIHRIGSDNKYYAQTVILRNIITNELYSLYVGASNKTDTEKSFRFHIKPGMYKIQSYWYWTVSKWLIGKEHYQPIFKDTDNTLLDKIAVSDDIANEYKLESYYIEIRPNSIYYLGTWDFSSGVVSFSDDKVDHDKNVSKIYRKIPFDQAITKLPE